MGEKIFDKLFYEALFLFRHQALLDSVGPTVESAVAEETDGLPELVDDFENVFYDDPIIRLADETSSLTCRVY